MVSKAKNPDPVARQDDGSSGGNVDSRCSPQLVVTQPGRKQRSSKENTGWWLSSQGGATSARRLVLRQGRNHCGHHSIHSAAQQKQKENKKPMDMYFSQCEQPQDLKLFLQVLKSFTLEGLFTVESQWQVCAAANAPAAFCVPLATFFTM